MPPLSAASNFYALSKSSVFEIFISCSSVCHYVDVYSTTATIIVVSYLGIYTIFFVLRFFSSNSFRNFVFQTLGKITGTAIATIDLLHITIHIRCTLTILFVPRWHFYSNRRLFFCYIFFSTDTAFDIMFIYRHRRLYVTRFGRKNVQANTIQANLCDCYNVYRHNITIIISSKR